MSRQFLIALFSMLAGWAVTGCVTTPANPALTRPDEAQMRARLEQASMPRQLKDLIIRLHHADPVERAWAAYQLAKLGRSAAPAVPYLITLLEDDTSVLLTRYLGGGFHTSSDTSPADEAMRALAKIGDPATTSLILALQHANPGVRYRAAKALGQISDINAVEFLLGALNDNDRKVRATAAIALGSYRHPQAAQLIMDAWNRRNDPIIQSDMVYALAQINDITAVPFLIDKAQTPSPNLRAAIMYALGELRDARAITALLAGLNDNDEIVRANAAYALSAYYTPNVIDALIAALEDPVPQVRKAVIQSLQTLTGMHLGEEHAQWTQWWAATRSEIQQDNSQSQ